MKNYYIGFCRKFQGIGLMISCNNPIVDTNYCVVEFRLLWFKCWVVIK